MRRAQKIFFRSRVNIPWVFGLFGGYRILLMRREVSRNKQLSGMLIKQESRSVRRDRENSMGKRNDNHSRIDRHQTVLVRPNYYRGHGVVSFQIDLVSY